MEDDVGGRGCIWLLQLWPAVIMPPQVYTKLVPVCQLSKEEYTQDLGQGEKLCLGTAGQWSMPMDTQVSTMLFVMKITHQSFFLFFPVNKVSQEHLIPKFINVPITFGEGAS